MELYLQIGAGMRGHAKTLVGRWKAGGAILSPRDLEQEQIVKFSGEFTSVGGEPMLDPQCYVKSADHERLVGHPYWEAITKHATGAFTGGPGTDALLGALATLVQSAVIRTHIVPACLGDPVDDAYLASQAAVLSSARKHFTSGPVLATVALSSAALRNEDQVEAIVEAAANWDVDGYYVVAEAPDGYLVDDPIWLGNLLILASGLKLHGRRVIVGYSHHQMLCLAAANVDQIACGTFLNVRSFDTTKFFEKDEGETSRRTNWYYAPDAFSEYKLPFLDIAMKMGVLDVMRPPKRFRRDFSDPLFAGAQPSTVGWKEPEAFRHYLDTLRQQAAEARKGSFDETVDAYNQQLDQAEQLTKMLAKKAIKGQDRDFANFIDVNRAALALLVAARGARLRRRW